MNILSINDLSELTQPILFESIKSNVFEKCRFKNQYGESIQFFYSKDFPDSITFYHYDESGEQTGYYNYPKTDFRLMIFLDNFFSKQNIFKYRYVDVDNDAVFELLSNLALFVPRLSPGYSLICDSKGITEWIERNSDHTLLQNMKDIIRDEQDKHPKHYEILYISKII